MTYIVQSTAITQRDAAANLRCRFYRSLRIVITACVLNAGHNAIIYN